MSDTDEREAGTIILRDLGLLNKAVVLFEDKIEPAIFIVIAEIVKDWLEQKAWKGLPNGKEDMYFWVCPSAWYPENEQPLAKFSFIKRPNSDISAYDIADLCGVGHADFGFLFEVGSAWFGGVRSWIALFKGMSGLADEIVKKGWTNVGKGMFFKPIKIPVDVLARAWELDEWSEIRKALEQNLDALVSDHAVFDQLLNAAKSSIEGRTFANPGDAASTDLR